MEIYSFLGLRHNFLSFVKNEDSSSFKLQIWTQRKHQMFTEKCCINWGKKMFCNVCKSLMSLIYKISEMCSWLQLLCWAAQVQISTLSFSTWDLGQVTQSLVGFCEGSLGRKWIKALSGLSMWHVFNICSLLLLPSFYSNMCFLNCWAFKKTATYSLQSKHKGEKTQK